MFQFQLPLNLNIIFVKEKIDKAGLVCFNYGLIH